MIYWFNFVSLDKLAPVENYALPLALLPPRCRLPHTAPPPLLPPPLPTPDTNALARGRGIALPVPLPLRVSSGAAAPYRGSCSRVTVRRPCVQRFLTAFAGCVPLRKVTASVEIACLKNAL